VFLTIFLAETALRSVNREITIGGVKVRVHDLGKA
jgi:hypothetical protein